LEFKTEFNFAPKKGGYYLSVPGIVNRWWLTYSFIVDAEFRSNITFI